LNHTGIAEPHFDLMFETAPGSPLATWRCHHWPPSPDEKFQPLGDHRRDYLDYQGPVSNHRGQVRQIASGYLISLKWIAPHWHAEFPDQLKLILPR
jgi:hypothetical protein